MLLEWKTSEVEYRGEKFTVTHWKRHAPRRLLRLLERKPLRRIGEHPPVAVHRFGPHTLSVRQFDQAESENFLQPAELFRHLQETVALKSAVVEMPVAFIQRWQGSPVIVTLFKKRTRDFLKFIRNKRLPVALREKACIAAVRRVAQLRAAGLRHGHVFTNFVADSKGNAYIV